MRKPRNDIKDETGNKYGRLTVISEAGRSKAGNVMWNCICDCGNERIVSGASLRKGSSKSCGCLHREIASKRMKGKNNPNYGIYKFGKDNPNWKGGITPKRKKEWGSQKHKQWRTSIFERDKFTCQRCNQFGGNLNAHHIESFNDNPNLRTTLSNGITFCEDCHKNFHHRYSYGNNTKEQLNNFLKEK